MISITTGIYVGSFIKIGQWECVEKWGERFGGRRGFRGKREFRKKIRKSQMLSQNKSMQEVSSMSDNGRTLKVSSEGGTGLIHK